MKVIILILLAVSAIALLLAALMGLNIITGHLMQVGGRGFLELSTACSLLAIALHIIKPIGGGGTEG